MGSGKSVGTFRLQFPPVHFAWKKRYAVKNPGRLPDPPPVCPQAGRAAAPPLLHAAEAQLAHPSGVRFFFQIAAALSASATAFSRG